VPAAEGLLALADDDQRPHAAGLDLVQGGRQRLEHALGQRVQAARTADAEDRAVLVPGELVVGAVVGGLARFGHGISSVKCGRGAA